MAIFHKDKNKAKYVERKRASIEEAAELGYINPISKTLFDQLMKITPSIDSGIEYRPCQAILENDKVFDRVYFVQAESYIRYWGIWPEEDEYKKSISIKDVKYIDESPHRLPPEIANRIYKSGEAGMGYFIYTLLLTDGRKLPYVTGDAVDFPNLPPDANMKMVIDVSPHEKKNLDYLAPKEHQKGADYYWCIYLLPMDVEGGP